MTKYLRVFTIVVVSLAVLSGTASALNVNWFDVTLTVDGASKNYRTTTATVGEFLSEQNVDLGALDAVTPARDTALAAGETTEITIQPGFNVVVNIDGKTETSAVVAGTKAGEVIQRLEQERNTSYAFAGVKDEELTPNKVLKLSTIYTEEQVTHMPLMYDTEIVQDNELEIGDEEVVQDGEPGELQMVSTLTYMGGQLVKSQVMSESIIKLPVSEIVHRGTKQPQPKVETESGSKVYTRVIEMSATAYSAHYECTGKNPGDPGYGITASGRRVDHGIVAVDPSVIPLGTRLYVEGYGEAIAADTGSAIVGNKIDLYHESLEDAKRYGRRTIKVYILA